MDARKSAKFLAFAGFHNPLSEFGARKYFTDHDASYTIHGFGDSVVVCKIHGCYCRICKNFVQDAFLSIQATSDYNG